MLWKTFLLTFSSHPNLVTWEFIGVKYLINRNNFVFELRTPLTIWVACWTRHSIPFNGITNQKGRKACHWVLSLFLYLKMQVTPLSAYDEGWPSTTLVSVPLYDHNLLPCHDWKRQSHLIHLLVAFTYVINFPGVGQPIIAFALSKT